MPKRLVDPVECRKVTDSHPDYFTFDVETWFSNDMNYAFIEGRDIAFAEYKSPGVYWMHFCFDDTRGRGAISLCKRWMKHFSTLRDVKCLIGLIVLSNKKARWMTRQVGFTSLGEVDTKIGPCEMFYITKEDINGFL